MATTSYKQPKDVALPTPGDVVGKATLKNRASAGGIHTADTPEMKTAGIKIRGTGAATKGTTARGPMA
jgi:hypothetical protein